jgi:hypothetical protein
MRTTIALASAIGLILGLASCANEPVGFGATTAGPTMTSPPSESPEAAPSTPATASTPGTSASPCGLFTRAEITKVLGLAVRRAVPSRPGHYLRCTWKAQQKPAVPSWRRSDPVTNWDDGIVTITSGDVKRYGELAKRVTALAGRQRATGRKELTWIGPGAFAIGGSISGVPIWHAIAVHHGRVIAVEVSGAESRSSVAVVGDFLFSTLDR